MENYGKYGKCGNPKLTIVENMEDTENMESDFLTRNETYGHAEPGDVWRECARCPRTIAARPQCILKWIFESMENMEKYGKYGKLWKIWNSIF